MEVRAHVVEIDTSGVWVVRDPDTCNTCVGKSLCHASTAEVAKRTFRFDHSRSSSFRVGDAVEIECASPSLLRAALWAYGLPVVLCLGGAVSGEILVGHENAAGFAPVVGAFLGTLLGFLLLRMQKFSKIQPRIVSRMSSE